MPKNVLEEEGAWNTVQSSSKIYAFFNHILYCDKQAIRIRNAVDVYLLCGVQKLLRPRSTKYSPKSKPEINKLKY